MAKLLFRLRGRSPQHPLVVGPVHRPTPESKTARILAAPPSLHALHSSCQRHRLLVAASRARNWRGLCWHWRSDLVCTIAKDGALSRVGVSRNTDSGRRARVGLAPPLFPPHAQPTRPFDRGNCSLIPSQPPLQCPARAPGTPPPSSLPAAVVRRQRPNSRLTIER